MRDTMAGTGLRFKELNEHETLELGCLSAVQRLQRQDLLSHQEYLCAAAASSGQLEEMKELRENDSPWNALACAAAAMAGHLEVLQWARAQCCPWNWCTCVKAAEGGHLKLLSWARANGCPE